MFLPIPPLNSLSLSQVTTLSNDRGSRGGIDMGDKLSGVGEAMVDDLREGMNCSDHPHNNNSGGICAICLQDKLGKLFSSNSSDPFSRTPPPICSSSSSPTCFPPSDITVSGSSFPKHHSSKTKKPILSAHSTAVRLKKVTATNPDACDIVLRQNKSVCTQPLRDTLNKPRKKSFWSFFTISYTSFASSTALPSSVITKRRYISSASSIVAGAEKIDNRTSRREQDKAHAFSAAGVGNDNNSPSGNLATFTFGRNVDRSRSVGCGSRSFSGDFLERISKGLGDCALRRVGSQREAKPNTSFHRRQHHGEIEFEEQGINNQIKCGGFFESLSAISSSTYWLHAASTADEFNDRLPANRRGGALHGLRKSWAWAFASPVRAFRSIGSGDQNAIIAAGSTSHGGRVGGVIPSS